MTFPASSRIFSFWEPRGAVPAYLDLCRRTWDRHLVGGESILIDYSNLEEHIGEGVLDMATLRRLPLPAQKDAILVAVLHAQGGLFLDLDTLLCGDVAPLLAELRRTEIVRFGPHLGVVAARRGGRLTALWLREVQSAMRRVASGEVALPLAWDFIGYKTLDRALATLREQARHRRLIRSTAPGRGLWRRFGDAKAPPGAPASLLRRLPRRVEWELTKRHLARHLLTLDRKVSIAESRQPKQPGMTDRDRFVGFWLDEGGSPEEVLRPGVSLLQLHNSWLPDWFLRLDRDAVLAHPSRLSAVLRHLLGGSPEQPDGPGIPQSP